MAQHTLTIYPLGPLDVNSHIISHQGQALLIDVGGDPKEIIDHCRKNSLTIAGILLTHLHFDHIYGVAELSRSITPNIPVYAHADDAWMLDCEYGQGGVWGMPTVPPFTITNQIKEGTQTLGGMEVTVLHTPGHSPGGVCYYFPQFTTVFTGDTLFRRSVGRSDFPKGDQTTLFTSIKSKLYTLPAETNAYPGHGEATSIGEEASHNPYISNFT